jgi:hypothetical protein
MSLAERPHLMQSSLFLENTAASAQASLSCLPFSYILSSASDRGFLARPDDVSFAHIRQRCVLGGALNKIATESSTQSARLAALETVVHEIQVSMFSSWDKAVF